jgi:hypothetical protein
MDNLVCSRLRVVGCESFDRVPPAPGEDTKRLLVHNEAHGWSGMLGSVDCTIHHHDPTILHDAVASTDL